MNKNKSTRNVFIITLALNIGAFALYAFLFFQNSRLENQLGEITADAETVKNQGDSLRLMREIEAKTADKIKQLDTYFVPSDGVVTFLDYIESLGARNRLKVKVGSVGIEPAKPEQSYLESLKLSAEAEGKWQDVYRFVLLLETLPYKTSISRVRLEEGETESAASKKSGVAWKASLDLSVLKLK